MAGHAMVLAVSSAFKLLALNDGVMTEVLVLEVLVAEVLVVELLSTLLALFTDVLLSSLFRFNDLVSTSLVLSLLMLASTGNVLLTEFSSMTPPTALTVLPKISGINKAKMNLSFTIFFDSNSDARVQSLFSLVLARCHQYGCGWLSILLKLKPRRHLLESFG